ncbi:hypothetical protein NEF87_004497 [Candidatus Lokiarchaeum ossiferum]|uniref:GTP-binding protein n=1 Tax=Candidatus Lokiarchaeum ossiferum TaxID=2951803 RepID=A0ABY6HXF9_9ARCH|nr:hypothetical protein NEF87_004497 [Candidatus Lokiarchaeum sp. B-35]
MAIKIPIIGIDNSGKTSIVKTFQREFKALSKLKPTKGIERTKINFLDKEIVIWDLGGQSKLRQKHIKKAEINFSDIDECFYVIDIQDQSSFNDAINYFQAVRVAILEYSPEAKINIVINKLDPGMELDADTMRLAETVGQKFVEMAKPLEADIFHTSIFNPISVIHALSKALMGNSILMDNFGVIFSEFVEKNNFQENIDFIIIYSENFVEIGSYFASSVDQEMMKNVAPELFSSFESKKVELNMADFSLQTGPTSIQISRFTHSKRKFFLSIGYNNVTTTNPEEILAKTTALKEEVQKIMLYF